MQYIQQLPPCLIFIFLGCVISLLNASSPDHFPQLSGAFPNFFSLPRHRDFTNNKPSSRTVFYAKVMQFLTLPSTN